MENFENFIKRFKVVNWMNGNCYYFAIILKDKYPNGRIIYDPIIGHFMLKIKNKAYDFMGIHQLPETFYYWDELEKEDELLYKRLRRDCT